MDTHKFIDWIVQRLGSEPQKKDSGRIARLKRADNPKQAPAAWDILIQQGIKDEDFLPCLTVAAAMCRQNDPKDGSASLGRALRSCFDDKERGEMRLRRILACGNVEEICIVLRPILAFIAKKAEQKLSYENLLKDLIFFNYPDKQEKIKIRWARDFWAINKQTDGEDGL